MKPACAYCGSTTNKLTREHIWPSCIIKRVPSYDARYSERADRVFTGDLTISDVCHVCNNGPLSDLDSYICKLYDRWFVQFPERGQWLDFDYDWYLLGRWLLKISFNSARASRSDHEVLNRFADVILGVDSRPPDLAIWLDLAEPSYFEEQREGGVIAAKRVLPAMTRVCRIHIPNAEIPNYTVRLVAINAFYFYLAIPNQPYSGVFADLERVVEFFALMSALDPEQSTVRVKTTGLTSQLLIGPHLLAKKSLYDAHFRRKSNKGA
jgi:hypothetical protein